MTYATRRAIYGKLAGDTTLNGLLATPPAGWSKSIYYQLAPDDAAFPYVIFSKQAGTPTYALNKTGTLNADIWMVKGVARGQDADPSDSIQSRLDALLTDGALSISGANQLYLRRESDVDYAEVSDGIRYVHAGSLYRLVFTA